MMKVLCTRAADCESGATAMEYALTAAILSVALLTGAETVGTAIRHQFDMISSKVASTSTRQSGQGGATSMVVRKASPETPALADAEVSWSRP